MSSTIGFGLSIKTSSAELRGKVSDLAKPCGYLVSYDLSVVESEVLEGIVVLASTLEFDLLALLHAPPKPEVALAFDIVKEMRSLINHEEARPKFFHFLEELSGLLKAWVSEYTVFFASEWNTDLRVRRMEGSVNELITVLERQGGWYLLLFDPKRNVWEEFDEFPLVFTVKL